MHNFNTYTTLLWQREKSVEYSVFMYSTNLVYTGADIPKDIFIHSFILSCTLYTHTKEEKKKIIIIWKQHEKRNQYIKSNTGQVNAVVKRKQSVQGAWLLIRNVLFDVCEYITYIIHTRTQINAIFVCLPYVFTC